MLTVVSLPTPISSRARQLTWMLAEETSRRKSMASEMETLSNFTSGMTLFSARFAETSAAETLVDATTRIHADSTAQAMDRMNRRMRGLPRVVLVYVRAIQKFPG